MNKTATIVGIIIVLILAVGGIVYLNQSASTPDVTVGTNTTDQTGAGNTNTNTNTAGNAANGTPSNPSDSSQTTVVTTTTTQVPGKPTSTTGPKAFPTATTVTVTGGVVPNGAFTNYWFEYGTSASVTSKTATQNIGSGYALIATPAYIVGLKANTTYYYQLVAENSNGKVVGTQYTFKTTQNTPSPVGSIPAVKTLAANGVSNTSANLNANIDPNRDSTQYWFEYGTTKNLGSTSALASVGAGDVAKLVSLGLTDLATSTTYYFRINAQNQFGTVNGATLSFKTSK